MFTEDSRIMATKADVGGVPMNPRQKEIPNKAFDALYDIQCAAKFILAGQEGTVGGYTRVALQFPDSLLSDTVRVVTRIRETLAGEEGPEAANARRIFVLADNTFGACCPDEITAQHYSADAIVHFGSACMSKSTRLPVYYVHEAVALDVAAADAMSKRIAQRLNKEVLIPLLDDAKSADEPEKTRYEVVVFSSVVLDASIGTQLKAAVAAEFKPENAEIVKVSYSTPISGVDAALTCSESAAAEASPEIRETAGGLREWDVNGMRFAIRAAGSRQIIVFVGSPDASQLAQLAMVNEYNTTAQSQDAALEDDGVVAPLGFRIVDPTADEPTDAENAAVMKLMKRCQGRVRQRMFNVESVKGATAVGIIVASLSIQGYREAAEAVRAALIRSGRRAYLIYVGHPNEFKIANFADSMDIFCAIACPNSRLANFPSKEDNMMKPFVTPIEVMLALGHIDFADPECFTTAFGAVISVAEQAAGADETGETDEAEATTSRALVQGRPMNVAIAGGAGGSALERLYERSYVGLEPKIGETPVQTELVDGKSGIARGYAKEREEQGKSNQ